MTRTKRNMQRHENYREAHKGRERLGWQTERTLAGEAGSGGGGRVRGDSAVRTVAISHVGLSPTFATLDRRWGTGPVDVMS